MEPFRIEDFHAGHREPGVGFRYFVPSRVHRAWVWDDAALTEVLERATLRIGALDAIGRFVPDAASFLYLHMTRESVASSRIEGTRTRLEEAVLPEREIAQERREDWRETANHLAATWLALETLEDLPLGSRLIRMAHGRLLQGTRGAHLQPGAFRTSTNWIGGASLRDAVFIPPPHELIGELMGDLEHLMHDDRIRVPHLIRIGIAHYQFETIHPFLDGNGRVGRLLVLLYLVDKGLLRLPLLHLSSTFEADRPAYHEALTRGREAHDLLGWLRHFLAGIAACADESIARIERLLALSTRLQAVVAQAPPRKRESAGLLLQHLYRQPVLSIESARLATGTTFKATSNVVEWMESAGILEERTGRSRNRLLRFTEYLREFEAPDQPL
jgi:Fic family protein